MPKERGKFMVISRKYLNWAFTSLCCLASFLSFTHLGHAETLGFSLSDPMTPGAANDVTVSVLDT